MSCFIFSILPAPTAPAWDRDEERAKEKASKPSTALVSATKTAPPYGQRKGWIPRIQEDFGDGGSYPEIHVAQYPMNLGKPEHEKNAGNKANVLAVQLDASGKVKYDLLARQGHGKDKVPIKYFFRKLACILLFSFHFSDCV